MFVTWFSGFLRQNHDYKSAFGISLAILMVLMEAYAFIGLNTKIIKDLSKKSLVLPRQYEIDTVRKTQKFFGQMIHLLGYAIIIGVLAYGEYRHKTWNFVATTSLKNSAV